MQRRVLCVTLASTITSLICSRTCTGYRFRRLAVLAYCCRNHKAPWYLADGLHHWTDEAESRHRLRSGSCPRLIVPRTQLTTIGDRSFRVTVTRAWNSLSTNVTASTSLPSLKRQLKTFLFPNLSHYFKFLSLICVLCRRSSFI